MFAVFAVAVSIAAIAAVVVVVVVVAPPAAVDFDECEYLNDVKLPSIYCCWLFCTCTF